MRPLASLLIAVCFATPGLLHDLRADDGDAVAASKESSSETEDQSDVDLVLLGNGHRVAGVLEDHPTDPAQAVIRTSYGTLDVPRTLISGTQPGAASRLKALNDDDAPGLVAFARWALAHGHQTEALDALRKAAAWWEAHPDQPADLLALGQYARLVDRKNPEASFAPYRLYRSRGGTDKRYLDRLAQLEQIAGDRAPPTTASVAPPKAPAQPAVAAVQPGSGNGIELRGWQAEDPQWSNQVVPKPVALDAADAVPGITQALEVAFTGGEKEKAVIRRILNLNAEERPTVVMRIRNKCDSPIKIAIGIRTGDYVGYESLSQPVRVSAEWIDLRFNLRETTFKSEASNWTHSVGIDNLADVKELQVYVYNRSTTGKVLINGLRFMGKQEL